MGGLRNFGGAVAFGFAAIWIMVSLGAALVCLAAAVVGYGVGLVLERTAAKLAGRRREAGVSAAVAVSPSRPARELGGLPQWADALNSDLGHVYEPAAATSPLSREAEYGWPLVDETVVAVPSETLQ